MIVFVFPFNCYVILLATLVLCCWHFQEMPWEFYSIMTPLGEQWSATFVHTLIAFADCTVVVV